MAPLTRQTQKVFAGNASIDMLAVFGTMKTGTPQYSSNVETLQSATYSQGWSDAILDDKAPYLEEMNAVQYGLSYQLAYILQEGAFEYDAGTEYSSTSLVKVINGNKLELYHSLQDNNIGNPITNPTYWEKVQLSDGGRFIGEIVASPLPLTEAGLHLLDGALLSKDGIYNDFIDYIASIYNSSLNCFTTEASWQSTVSQYGSCGKFVYNSTNNTVRLPKITNILQATNSAATLGDITAAGLPNITGTAQINSSYGNNYAGALYKGASTSIGRWYNAGSGEVLNFDASRSNSIYGNSNTVQPQTTKVFYYIVVATDTKTDIQVDIDEIATDLNGKMDTDGTNAASSVAFADGQWIMSLNTIAHSTSISLNETKTYDLSSYLPNDNYSYEVLFGLVGQSGTSSGNTICAYIGSDIVNTASYVPIAYSATRTSGSAYGGGNAIIPIGSDRIVKITSYSSTDFTFSLLASAYRRIGTNS